MVKMSFLVHLLQCNVFKVLKNVIILFPNIDNLRLTNSKSRNAKITENILKQKSTLELLDTNK